LSEKANLVTSLPTEDEVDHDQGPDGVEKEANHGKPVARLPWTTSSSETVVMPWQSGPARRASQTSGGGSPFAVPAGPMPEDIPGFPFPEDIPGFPLADEIPGFPLPSANNPVEEKE